MENNRRVEQINASSISSLSTTYNSQMLLTDWLVQRQHADGRRRLSDRRAALHRHRIDAAPVVRVVAQRAAVLHHLLAPLAPVSRLVVSARRLIFIINIHFIVWIYHSSTCGGDRTTENESCKCTRQTRPPPNWTRSRRCATWDRHGIRDRPHRICGHKSRFHKKWNR